MLFYRADDEAVEEREVQIFVCARREDGRRNSRPDGGRVLVGRKLHAQIHGAVFAYFGYPGGLCKIRGFRGI